MQNLCMKCKQVFSSMSSSCPYCGSKDHETIVDKNNEGDKNII